jgi:chromosomal replication initiation ATPase DnaA
MERRYRLKAVGFTLEKLARRVAEIFGMEVGDIGLSGKHARIVPARSVFCYWAAEELGMRETEVARRLKLTQPAVCISVRRGEHIAKEKGLDILGE